MTAKDQSHFLYLILRPGMYFHPLDLNSMVIHISGYEIGRGKKCHLSEYIKALAEKYKIQYRATGWPGQVHRLAEKRKTEGVTVLRQMIFEILMKKGLSKKEMLFLKNFIITQQERINDPKLPFHEHAKKEFMLFVNKENRYLRAIWKEEEWKTIQQMHKTITGIHPRAIRLS